MIFYTKTDVELGYSEAWRLFSVPTQSTIRTNNLCVRVARLMPTLPINRLSSLSRCFAPRGPCQKSSPLTSQVEIDVGAGEDVPETLPVHDHDDMIVTYFSPMPPRALFSLLAFIPQSYSPSLVSLQLHFIYQTRPEPLYNKYTQDGNVTERQSCREGHGPR